MSRRKEQSEKAVKAIEKYNEELRKYPHCDDAFSQLTYEEYQAKQKEKKKKKASS